MEKKGIIISCTAITGIVILDSIALFMGIDGALMLTSLASVAGIAGYKIRELKS